MPELYCSVYVRSDDLMNEIKEEAEADSATIRKDKEGITELYFEDLDDEPQVVDFLFQNGINYDISIYKSDDWNPEEKSYRLEAGEKEFSALVTEEGEFLSSTKNIVDFLNGEKTLEELKQDNAVQLMLVREKYPLIKE